MVTSVNTKADARALMTMLTYLIEEGRKLPQGDQLAEHLNRAYAALCAIYNNLPDQYETGIGH